MVWWPSGKATVCKTVIHRFKSGPDLEAINMKTRAIVFLYFT